MTVSELAATLQSLKQDARVWVELGEVLRPVSSAEEVQDVDLGDVDVVLFARGEYGN